MNCPVPWNACNIKLIMEFKPFLRKGFRKNNYSEKVEFLSFSQVKLLTSGIWTNLKKNTKLKFCKNFPRPPFVLYRSTPTAGNNVYSEPGISKNYCATNSAWSVVELRFCPRYILFKYLTGGPDLSSSLCTYYVYLFWWPTNEEEAFFWPIAFSHLCCDTQTRTRLHRRAATYSLPQVTGPQVKYTY